MIPTLTTTVKKHGAAILKRQHENAALMASQHAANSDEQSASTSGIQRQMQGEGPDTNRNESEGGISSLTYNSLLPSFLSSYWTGSSVTSSSSTNAADAGGGTASSAGSRVAQMNSAGVKVALSTPRDPPKTGIGAAGFFLD